jgi:membrane-associated phospholipid phosphatase
MAIRAGALVSLPMVLVLSAVLLCQTSLTLQEEPPPDPFSFREAVEKTLDLAWTGTKTLAHDTAYLLTAPLRLNSETLVPTIAALGIVGVAFGLDELVREFSQDHHSSWIDSLEPIGGNGLVMGSIILGTIAAGALSDTPWLLEMGLTMAEAEIICLGLSTGLKYAFGRERPFEAERRFDFNPFGGDDSFPSGHVMHVAALTAVASAYIDNWAFDVAAYSLLGLVMWQRINDDRHWFSDVTLSAVLGIAVGRTLVEIRKNPNLRILPWVTVDNKEVYAGISVTIGK